MLLRKCFLVMFILLLISPAVWAEDLSHIWSKRFGDLDDQIAHSVAVDRSNNVIIAGCFKGVVDFGCNTLTSAGGWDIFIVKFNSNGDCLWSHSFGDSNDQCTESVSVDSNGNIVVAGEFCGTVNFGGEPLATTDRTDIFIAEFDSDGNHLWSKRFGDVDEYQSALSVAADESGNVLVTGEFAGTVDFGGGSLISAGNYDIFVVKFDSYGNHLWSKRFGDVNYQHGFSVTADGLGNVLLTGEFEGVVNFGGATYTSEGYYDLFVVKFDPNGNHLWSERFGGVNNQHGRSVVIDGSGNVIFTGYFLGTVDFGGGPLISAGLSDIFIAKLGSPQIPTLSTSGIVVLSIALLIVGLIALRLKVRGRKA